MTLLLLGRQWLLLGGRRRFGADSEVELLRNLENVVLGGEIARRALLVGVARRLEVTAL